MKEKLKILLVSTIAIIFFSCNNDSESIDPVSIKENDIASVLSFKSIDIDELVASKWCGHIVSWDEWGRKKKKCDGWGLCNAEWFNPCPVQKQVKLEKLKSSSVFVAKVLTEDLTGKNYILIPLKKPLPSSINTDDLSLKIDEDIILNTKKTLGKSLIFHSGIYEFDKNVDEYGGYKIFLN